MDDIEFKKKYMKYKLKYLKLIMLGGMSSEEEQKNKKVSFSKIESTPKKFKQPDSFLVNSTFTPSEKIFNKENDDFDQLFKIDRTTDDKLNSLKELSNFYYENSKHNTEPTIDLIELLSDMRHDMSSSDRKQRINYGKYKKDLSSENLLQIYIQYLNNHYLRYASLSLRQKINEHFNIPATEEFNLNKLCEKLTDDESIKIDSSQPSKISLQGQIKRWNRDNYILCGTPINTFTNKPFLLTKDTGAAEGKIGKNAILSELDGLKHIDESYSREALEDEPFVKLLYDLEGNGRYYLYQEIMEFYFNKNIRTLKLASIFPNLIKKDNEGNKDLNIKIDYRPISNTFGGYNWYVTFGYKLSLDYEASKYYEFIVDVTGRGSTQNCYNLKDLKLRYRIGRTYYNPKKETPAMPITDFIKKIKVPSEQTNFLCIINILCGLLLKASGDDTQQALNFALTNYVIIKDYIISNKNIDDIEKIEKLESSIITHDRQLLRRLLDKLLIIYKAFFNKIITQFEKLATISSRNKKKYDLYKQKFELLETKIENSITYKTANKHIKKNLLGLCQKVYLENNFPQYNYFKFHLENKPDEDNNNDDIIEYYFTLFLYIISTNERHLENCKMILIELSKKITNNNLTIQLQENYINHVINLYKQKLPFADAIQENFMAINDIVRNPLNKSYDDIVIKYVMELINGKYVNFITIVGDSFSLPKIQIAEIMKSHDNILFILCDNITLRRPYIENTQKFKIQMLSESISNTQIVDDYENWEELRENISGISREYYMEFVKYSYEKIIWKIFTIDDNIIEGEFSAYINTIIINCIRLNTSDDLEHFNDYQDASKTADGPTMLLRTQENLIRELIYTITIFADKLRMNNNTNS